MRSRRATRSLCALGAVVTCAAAVATAGAAGKAGGAHRAKSAAGKGAVITTGGSDVFKPNPANPPNKLDVVTLGWNPGTITVKSGQKLTLVDRDNFGDPHDHGNPFANPVVRVVAPEVLINPANPNLGFKTTVANRGKPGLNTIGDALVLEHKGSKVSAIVSAKPGTTLYYFCAIHFWMQGKIIVK
jgi:plastocyanin